MIRTSDIQDYQTEHSLSDVEIASALEVSTRMWSMAKSGKAWVTQLPEKRETLAKQLLSRSGGSFGGWNSPEPNNHGTLQRLLEPVTDEIEVDADAAQVPDVAVSDGDSDQSDEHGEIHGDAMAYLDELEEAPTSVQTAQICEALADAGASPAVSDGICEEILVRWYPDAPAKDKDRMRATFRKALRAAVKAIRVRAPTPNEKTIVLNDAEPTPEEREAIRESLWPRVAALATGPGVLKRAVDMVHSLDVTGEENTIKLVVLAGTSRVLHKPICPLIDGASGGGKTWVSQQALELFPPEDVKVVNGGSSLSLVYDEWPIKHRILVIYEATPLQRDDNSQYANMLRTLISEGRIVWTKTVEDPDCRAGHRVETIIKEGPTCVVVTTTADSIHAENETRMLRYGVTETTEQTKAVMASIARSAMRSGKHGAGDEAELGLWRDFQRWIGAGPRDVVVPFAGVLAEKIPPLAVRLRRDMSSLLGLIRSHALLNQAQREITDDGAIIATVDDYSAIRPIIANTIAESVGSRPTDKTVRIVGYVAKKLEEQKNPTAKPAPARRQAFQSSTPDAVTVSARKAAADLGLDHMSANRAIQTAISEGYLELAEREQQGSPRVLRMGKRTLANHAEGSTILPDAEAVLEAMRA